MPHLLDALLATARLSLRSRRRLALENLALDKDAPEPRERESADGGNVIALGEQHLRRILRKSLEYVHGSRTHLTLDQDAPEHRKRESAEAGNVIALPIVGGLHHRYTRRAA